MYIIGLVLCLSSIDYQCIQMQPDPIIYFDTATECKAYKDKFIKKLGAEVAKTNEFSLVVGECIYISSIRGA